MVSDRSKRGEEGRGGEAGGQTRFTGHPESTAAGAAGVEMQGLGKKENEPS